MDENTKLKKKGMFVLFACSIYSCKEVSINTVSVTSGTCTVEKLQQQLDEQEVSMS